MVAINLQALIALSYNGWFWYHKTSIDAMESSCKIAYMVTISLYLDFSSVEKQSKFWNSIYIATLEHFPSPVWWIATQFMSVYYR